MNKVLLITKDYQPDVDNVIEWLIYNKIEFVRISPSTTFQIKNISIENEKQSVLEIVINNSTYIISDFTSFWISNGVLSNTYLSYYLTIEDELDESIALFFNREWKTLMAYSQ